MECDVGGDDCTRISNNTKKLENKLIPVKCIKNQKSLAITESNITNLLSTTETRIKVNTFQVYKTHATKAVCIHFLTYFEGCAFYVLSEIVKMGYTQVEEPFMSTFHWRCLFAVVYTENSVSNCN